jgi:hypothetical protein
MTDQTESALVLREELIVVHAEFFRFSIAVGHVGHETLAAEMNETAEELMVRAGISFEEVLTAYEARNPPDPTEPGEMG